VTLSPYPCLYVKPDGNCPYTPTYQARECVSGVAWWASQYTGKSWPRGWGNALNWPAMARAAGFTVNASCAPNTIMCVPPLTNGSGAMGHVAYVVGAVQAGRAEVWEMDFEVRFGFGTRPAPVHQCEFIHLVAAPAPDPPSLPGESDMVVIYQFPTEIGTFYQIGSFVSSIVDIADQERIIAAAKAAGVPVMVVENASAALFAQVRKSCCTPF